MEYQNASDSGLAPALEEHKIVLAASCLVSLLLGIPLIINVLQHLKERHLHNINSA